MLPTEIDSFSKMHQFEKQTCLCCKFDGNFICQKFLRIGSLLKEEIRFNPVAPPDFRRMSAFGVESIPERQSAICFQ